MATLPNDAPTNPDSCSPLFGHGGDRSPAQVAVAAIYGADMTGQTIALCPCIARGWVPRIVAETGCGVCGQPIYAQTAAYPVHVANITEHAATVGETSSGAWCERCGELIALYRLTPADEPIPLVLVP